MITWMFASFRFRFGESSSSVVIGGDDDSASDDVWNAAEDDDVVWNVGAVDVWKLPEMWGSLPRCDDTDGAVGCCCTRLNALCFSGKWFTNAVGCCDVIGTWCDVLGADASRVSSAADDAIFLNFLCMYLPSLSSHRCSTGSTAGVAWTGRSSSCSSLARFNAELASCDVRDVDAVDDRELDVSVSAMFALGETLVDLPPERSKAVMFEKPIARWWNTKINCHANFGTVLRGLFARQTRDKNWIVVFQF